MLAAGVAPALVRAESLMRIASPIVLPTTAEYGAIVGGGSQLLTIEMITREALQILHKNLIFKEAIGNNYSKQFLNQTIRVWRPE